MTNGRDPETNGRDPETNRRDPETIYLGQTWVTRRAGLGLNSHPDKIIRAKSPSHYFRIVIDGTGCQVALRFRDVNVRDVNVDAACN